MPDLSSIAMRHAGSRDRRAEMIAVVLALLFVVASALPASAMDAGPTSHGEILLQHAFTPFDRDQPRAAYAPVPEASPTNRCSRPVAGGVRSQERADVIVLRCGIERA